MSQTYEEAEAVKTIADRLIGTHHPELAGASFRYIFKEKCSKKGGKPVFGAVKKMSDLMKYLIDADFMMELPLDVWNELDASKRTALVDHLLERCTGEEDEQTSEMKWSIREPDVNEFSSILRRHGPWHEDLTNFASVAQTLDLSFMAAEVDENETVQTAVNE